MKKKQIIFLAMFFAWYNANCQDFENDKKDTLRIVFYNTENLYDPFNDSLKMDDDFLPTEPRAWGYNRFRTKIIHIAKALVSAGQWHTPGIIGLCEIENIFVLKQLVNNSPLKKTGYHIIHEESPDPRGVDVALLYDPEQYQPLYHRAISMFNPLDTSFKTRDILYVKGLMFQSDTLHVFVNHWPSKYGGLASSLEKRKFVAKKLKATLDSIQRKDRDAKILLMGDFNDGADQEVMMNLVKSNSDTTFPDQAILINLMLKFPVNRGSHKFRGEWTTLDQFIVSKTLSATNPRVAENSVNIVSDDFLLEEDNTFSGHKPYRTYAGPQYTGGYSDHLPIRLDIIVIP